jgi:hypothetical protein
MERQQLSGYIMAGVGFIMILINALGYLLGWDLKFPVFTILGLVLIVTGVRTARKSTWIWVWIARCIPEVVKGYAVIRRLCSLGRREVTC